MRLLVVSSWCPAPPDNGSRLRAFHLLTQLAARHRITLLAFGRGDRREDAAALARCCEHHSIVRSPPGPPERVTVRGLLSPVPRSHVQSARPEMTALVRRHVDDHDAVLALQIQAAFHVGEAAGRRPSVFDELEVGSARDRYRTETHALRRLRRRLTWWKFVRFNRSLAAEFDRATVVSETERDLLASLGFDVTRVAVVPNGVDVQPMAVPASREARLIYPGSVTYSANLDAVRYFVRDVFPEIRRTHADLRFVVTGSTDGCDVSDLAGTAGVTFTGLLPDVDDLVARSLACVVPLRQGGGTRLKVLQAMALGVPVVSTTKGIEGLDVEAERHVLVGDSPAAFAAQVGRLAADPALVDQLVSAARARVVERYTWASLAKALERVLEAAVAGRNLRRATP